MNVGDRVSDGKTDSEHSERAYKIQRVHDPQAEPPQQLPSPFSARRASFEDHSTSLDNPAVNQKRKAESFDADRRSRKRHRKLSQTDTHPSVDEWLSNVPETFEDMSQPSSKRSRSSDALGRRLSQSSDETETTVSRDGKYSVYKNLNYAMILETKNSFMRASPTGIIDEDQKLCHKFLEDQDHPIPQNSMFDADKFEGFCSHLQGRSEARVYLQLHPLFVPSAENLFICGQKNLEYLIEGYNDRWVKAIPFYGSQPQPDHTVGLKWSAFTELQRRKLGIDFTSKSYYTARDDIYFPFLTTEVKCGKSELDLADRANANSMTIAVRGVVELFRKAGRPMDIHRRALGFSISYDEKLVRLYAHYPEIDGDKTTFWRYTIKEFLFQDCDGAHKWTCYTFTRNIYEKFVPIYLETLKGAIDQLPDPLETSFESAVTATDEESAFSSQEIALNAPESQSEFRKPRPTKGLIAELRTMNQNLLQQLEQQQKNFDKQREESKQQLAQQREESKQQLEQQQKNFDKQREESKQQLEQLTQLLQQHIRGSKSN
jgi:hypothetical protein